MSAVFCVTAGSAVVVVDREPVSGRGSDAGAFCLAGLAAWLTLRFIPNNAVGVVEKLWSQQGSVLEGRIIATGDEAGFQVRPVARWRALRLLALAVSRSQDAAGHDPARQDRLRLCPRRQTAAAQPDLGTRCPLQQLSGCAGISRRATRSRASAVSAAGNWRSCAKASTPSIRRCSW